MKLKYYLRGLGIGIIITTIILSIVSGKDSKSMSDEEVIARASELGMVMEEKNDGLFGADTESTETEEPQTSQTEEARTEVKETETQETESKETESREPETEVKETESGESQTGEKQTEETEVETYTLVVQPGEVCRNVCEKLAAAGIVDDAEVLRKYLSEKNIADFISVGTYEVPMNASMEDIAAILEAGSIEKQQENQQ